VNFLSVENCNEQAGCAQPAGAAMSYQANNNPGMQGGYFQTPNDFRTKAMLLQACSELPEVDMEQLKELLVVLKDWVHVRDKLLARAMSKFLIIFKLRTRAMLQACRLPDLILLPQVEE